MLTRWERITSLINVTTLPENQDLTLPQALTDYWPCLEAALNAGEPAKQVSRNRVLEIRGLIKFSCVLCGF